MHKIGEDLVIWAICVVQVSFTYRFDELHRCFVNTENKSAQDSDYHVEIPKKYNIS